MSVDLKTLTPDTTINDSAVLFGADSQASASPSVYSVGTVRGHIVATANTFTQPQIVSVNSASTALRITQTGFGNAFVVEDSANPDATPFVIDAGGSVIIGANTPFTASTLAPGINFQGIGGTAAANVVGINAFGNNNAGPVIYFGKTRGATIGSAGLVSNSDFLGAMFFEGSDGSAQRRGASIVAQVDGTPGASDMPGRLIFSTTADGGSSTTERMRITSAGNLLFGTTSSPTTGTQCLTVATGTAPTATPADTVTMYSSDRSAGNTIPSFYCEGAGVTNAGITSTTVTNKIAVRINGTVYYLLATTSDA